MYALTIWQPWASLIQARAKAIEWRGWRYPRSLLGTRIAIHAGARPIRRSEVIELLLAIGDGRAAEMSLVPWLAKPVLERALTPGALPLATILCTARLGEPIPAAQYAAMAGVDSDRVDHAKWGWPLEDIQDVTPFVPATGHQGFWKWEGQG